MLSPLFGSQRCPTERRGKRFAPGDAAYTISDIALQFAAMRTAVRTASSSPCMLERLHSHDVEPARRFDYWREHAHQWMELQPLSPDAPLDAQLLMLRSGNCLFGAMRSSAYDMREAPRRLAHAPSMMVMALIQAGEVLRDAAPGEPTRIGPGMLGLYDPWRQGNYRWSHGAREAFLALPRDDVVSALGYEPRHRLIAPGQCALAPALSAQLAHVALLLHQPQALDSTELDGLLQTTRALALLALRNLGRHGHSRDAADLHEDLNRGRHAAALRFMADQAHRHDLDVAAIAGGTGCSRTRLYEAFAAQGATVMGALREMRLQRAKGLMAHSPHTHLGALAWRCGFADQSGFSKAFRARFGWSPSQWQQQLWAEPKDEA